MKPYKTQPIPVFRNYASGIVLYATEIYATGRGYFSGCIIALVSRGRGQVAGCKKITLHRAGRINALQGRDRIQQLLRIRHQQGRSR